MELNNVITLRQILTIYPIFTAAVLHSLGQEIHSEIDWSVDCESGPKGQVISLQLSSCNSKTDCFLVANDDTRHELTVQFIPSTGHTQAWFSIFVTRGEEWIDFLIGGGAADYPANKPVTEKLVFRIKPNDFNGTAEWTLSVAITADTNIEEVCKQFQITIVDPTDNGSSTTNTESSTPEVVETSTSSAPILTTMVSSLLTLVTCLHLL